MTDNVNFINTELLYKKAFEKRMLSKKSNGLGFFVLSYVLTMVLGSMVLSLLFIILTPDSFDISEPNTGYYLFNIFISVFSSFIPSLLYIVFSKSDINDIIKCKYVKLAQLVPLVFIGMAVAMLANYLSDLMSKNFSVFGLENHIDFNNSSNSPFDNLLYVVATALVPAFAEEFAFRGILMGTLRKHGDVFAIVVSAVMFGAMHGNITQIPFAFILGLIFAFIDCKTNSIVPSIIIHFINNFYAIIMDILNNENIISDNVLYLTNYLCIVIFCILGLISFIIISRRHKSFWKIKDKDNINNGLSEHLSLKEKNIAFFTAPSVIASLLFFVFETILYLIAV